MSESGDPVIGIGLSRPLPWRLETSATPPTLTVEFNSLSGGDVADQITLAEPVEAVRQQQADNKTRVTFWLTAPMRVAQAGMQVDNPDQAAILSIRLVPDPDPESDAVAGQGMDAVTNHSGDAARLVVMLDPGHGGDDRGAQYGGIDEADLVLDFTRALRDRLARDTGFDVRLTRQEDGFVSLYERVSQAREADADVFISIHADSVLRGQARGASVYTLRRDGEDPLNSYLDGTRPRGDLITQLDLTGHTDDVATALLDLSQRTTSPRSKTLAHSLVGAMADEGVVLYKHPEKLANFVVLRAPDIPSVLVELGFLSNPADRALITDPDWQRRMIDALTKGLLLWLDGSDDTVMR
ncbi:N-acetylmuramoyl-L-alanine amidase family protein [Qingshengfaniella alkalisoli]|nr:N-acetylmuramoyl-L-alanine amidase [Qingshengfaniella alkalisoli]